ncbi:hypothetical protein [Bacillus sp. 165]|uniref:hypothetical protein n=1 Tax=Bacillus sp. 165 TaxID=1529117 RepID=UPI001ADA353A|nr:hypothetical protein [Bacillus sp. 165]MBO9129687.1 hypothetical protein [Bacillus sp. 165]
MSVKKQTQVRTGKMVRELMLDDKDVAASLIMVYSNNGRNEEIKIEGLTPKSNEELFLSGNVDWNHSVIYKIVDFAGKAEVGKVTMESMNKNNLTLKIERIMWSKEKNGEKQEMEEELKEELKEEFEEEIQPVVELETPQEKPVDKQEENKLTLVHKEPKQEQPAVKKETTPLIKQKAVATTVPLQKATPFSSKTEDHYQCLVSKATSVCHDYDLGMDIDDSIEQLKKELQTQNVYVPLDKDVMDVVSQLRQLKEKGLNLDSIYKLI